MRAQLVTDSDLHVAHLAIVLSKTTAEAMPAVTIPKLKAVVLPKVLALLQSSLLQGVALRSLLALFAELVSQNVAELSFDALTTQLLSVGKAGTMSKHTLAALSQLVAACCAHVPAPAKRDTMVTHFTGQLSDGAAQQRTLALLCLGEIGRQTDLSAHKNLVAAVMTGFTMPEEEVKAAASSGTAYADAMASGSVSSAGLRPGETAVGFREGGSPGGEGSDPSRGFPLEPAHTTVTPGFTDCIDYVFVSEDVEVLGAEAIPGVGDALAAGLPNANRPSDHLPVTVRLAF